MKTYKIGISPNSTKIISGAYTVLIYDINDKEFKKEIDNHGKYIYSNCFINDNILALGNNTGSISLVDLNEYKFTNKIEEHCMPVRCLAYNKSKNVLYSASDDLHMNIIDINSQKVLFTMVGHKNLITNLIILENKGVLVSSSSDGNIKLWDISNNQGKLMFDYYNEDNKPIWDMTFDYNQDILFAIGENFFEAFKLYI